MSGYAVAILSKHGFLKRRLCSHCDQGALGCALSLKTFEKHKNQCLTISEGKGKDKYSVGMLFKRETQHLKTSLCIYAIFLSI